jgi:hypothetical protein
MAGKLLSQEERYELALIQRIIDLLPEYATEIVSAIDGELGPQWKQQFQVGALYVSISPTNPATTLGYGTWSAFGTGRVLVGVDTGDTDFDAVEETGGSKTATI